MREYDEDDSDIRRYPPFWRRVIILVTVIIAAPVMMWTITIFIRNYVGPKTPTFRHLTLTETVSLPPKPQAAQRAPAPLLTDAARTADDGLASLPDPNSGLKGPLALPPRDAPPPAASPTGPAETALNAPAVASGEAAAVSDSAHSAATAETASSEAVSPEAIRGSIPLQRDRLTATGPATVSTAPVGPVPLPRARPVDAPVDTPPVPSSPPSVLPLFAHPAPYGYQPGLESGTP